MTRLLPRLLGNHGVNDVPKGRWSTFPSAIFAKIAEDIDVAKQDYAAPSIPDVWARALIFGDALFTGNHMMHGPALAAWRGLLALLALRAGVGVRLSVISIPLKGVESTVANVFQKSQPADTAVPGESWDPQNILILEWREQGALRRAPIGLLTPLSLVASVADHKPVPNEFVRWFSKETGWKDPLEGNLLNSTERELLANWLALLSRDFSDYAAQKFDQLQAEIKALSRAPANESADDARQRELKLAEAQGVKQRCEARRDSLKTALNQFLLQAGGRPETLKEDYDDSKLSFRPGMFSFVARAHRAVVGDPAKSGYRLVTDGPSPGEKIYFYADPAMAGRDGPEKIAITGQYSLQNVLADPEGFRRLMSEGTGKEVRILNRNSLFLDKLYVVNRKMFPFPGAIYAQGDQSFLLPLKSEILDLFSAETLRQAVTVTRSSNDITVTVNLPRTDGVVSASKTYRPSDCLTRSRYPDVLVWPNLRAKNTETQKTWSAYFTYCLRGGMEEFYCEPYRPAETVWTSSPISSKDAPAFPGEIEARDVPQKEAMQVVSFSREFPNALVCYTDRRKEAGLILLQLPLERPLGGHEWSAGVDFGTTNTYVEFARGNDKAVPFKPVARVLRVTAVNEDTQLHNTTSFEFIPTTPGAPEPNNLPLPFLTMYRSRVMGPKLAHGGNNVFLRTNIPFNRIGWAGPNPGGQGGQSHGPDRRLEFNLKWDNSADATSKVKTFLQQLCLMIAADAAYDTASVLKISFSYPGAFQGERLRRFQLIFEDIAREVSDSSGVEIRPPRFLTESAAVALLLSERGGVAGFDCANFITVDIGGGTTDVGCWHGGKLAWEDSVRFAGQEIFTRPLLGYRALLGQLATRSGKSEAIEAVKELIQELEDPAASEIRQVYRMETVVSEHGVNWLGILRQLNGDKSLTEVRRGLYFRLGALIYYVGMLAGKSGTIPQGICVTGSGSRIFHWLTDSQEMQRNADRVLHSNRLEFFRDMFAAGAKIAPEAASDLKFAFSDKPKQEVAKGLLLFALSTAENEPNGLGSALNTTVTLPAENVIVRLNAFLKAFHDAARARTIPLDALAEAPPALTREAETALSAKVDKDARTLSMPAFLLAVRAYLQPAKT